MTTPGVILPRSVPDSKPIATLLSLSNSGDTNPVTAGGVTLTNLYDDNTILWHEGLLRIAIATTGGKGATPTAVGSPVTLTFNYAFTDTKLNATADAPTILATCASQLVCTLPNARSAPATGVLTFTGLPTAGQTVSIGVISGIAAGTTKVYKFVAALTGAANEVLIGASATACAQNLKAAILQSALLAGTVYGVGTAPHPDVTADNIAGVLTVTANNYDTSGNAITITENCSNAAWGGVTLSGGSAAGSALFATGAFVHLGRYLYTWYARDAFAANALIDVTARLNRL